MKNKPIVVKVGDWIVTNENFKVMDSNKVEIDKEGFLGIVLKVTIENGIKKYLVKLGEDLDWCDDFDGLLSTKSGYEMLEGEFYLDN